MYKLYGIKNCDTVKKAIKQLDAQGTPYEFVDLKTYKLSSVVLQEWLTQAPTTLINKRSTTYRAIKEEWLATGDNKKQQIALLQEHPTVIKRPVLETEEGKILVGFDAEHYAQL